MIINIKLSKQDEQYIKEVASRSDINVSEYIRQAVIDRIDYESDFQCHRNTVNKIASSRLSGEPVIYSFDESRGLVAL